MKILYDKPTEIQNIDIKTALSMVSLNKLEEYEVSYYKNNHDNKIHLVVTLVF